jgi:hypothetical protein
VAELNLGWLLTRSTVIVLAVSGGAISLAATALRKRQGSSAWARRLDIAAYGFMGVSMVLFIMIGLSGPRN